MRMFKSALMRPRLARGMIRNSQIKTMQNRTYKFKRTIVFEGALQGGVAGLPGGCTLALSFSLGQVNWSRSIQGGAAATGNISVPASTEMTNLFQQYKIDKVTVRVVPARPDADIASTLPTLPLLPGFPTLLAVTDYDDNDAPTTVAPLQECGDCTIKMLDSIKNYTVYPKFVGVVTGAPGTTVAGPPMRGFLDCAQPNIEHNGIKFGFISQPFTYASLYIDVFYTMRGSK